MQRNKQLKKNNRSPVKEGKEDFFSKIFNSQQDDNHKKEGHHHHPSQTPILHNNQPEPRRRNRPLPKTDFKMKSTKKNISSRMPSSSSGGMLLAAAESDSEEDDKPPGGDFEFDDGEGDDQVDEEPEIVGFGRNFNEPTHDQTLIKNEELDEGGVDFQDEEEEEDMDSERTGIRKELANLTYEELEALKQKMGLSLYNEAMFGTKAKKHLSKKKQMQLYKRENKNRPREISSRTRVPRVREVIHVKKVVKRDPRFDESCGELNKDIWDKNYDFLREMQQKEVQELKKSLKNIQDDEKRMEIKQYIQKFKNKEKSKSVNDKEIQKRKLEKEENMKRMAEGKNPFYIKKSTRKFLDLAEKYEELKSSGKLEKYLKKKRKKNQSRDRKTITSSTITS